MTTTAPTMNTTPGMQCYTCKDKQCTQQELTSCASTEPLCMNTISQTMAGERAFIKGCASVAECKDKWWLKTAGRADCFLLDDGPTGPAGLRLDACAFCCTGSGCNQHAIPDLPDMYQP
ncbi:collagen alpha-5(VI) chain [Elysia marginata]|uniref:Collagen alpha-5(VI) chain n=1 Tax=Elysia marginata TaxID=1093978 RepID=A0AAV4HXT6_9GAST|nr:collagen alpha-5(VI) chain [Elysia marginata]